MSMSNEILQEKFNILSKEVEEFVTINGALLEESGVYKGTQILYSKLISRPKFLFVGINPGPGYYNHNNGKKVARFSPLEKMEYVDERYDYRLSEETKDLFAKADCSDELQNAMKTNCYFFSTTNENELKILLNKIMHNGRPNIFREIEAWTKRIIEMVNPEIIICEGKSAFKTVAAHIVEGKDNWEDGYGFYKSENNTQVLGYERSFSNILNKEKVAAKIKELVS